MLYSGSFGAIDCNRYDEIWLIVRSLKHMPAGHNIYHVPQLAPSLDLFYTYLSLKIMINQFVRKYKLNNC